MMYQPYGNYRRVPRCIHTRKVRYPRHLCDGSCRTKEAETLTFEDGTQLQFFFCKHTRTHVLADIPAEGEITF